MGKLVHMAYSTSVGRCRYSAGQEARPRVGREHYLNPLREQHKMITSYEFLATWLRARFADTERGASLVEYALLVALIAVVCIIAIRVLGTKASSSFSSTGGAIN